MAEADDILAEGKRLFQLAVDGENDNRMASEEDIRFAKLAEQWPDEIRRQRELDGRPCLTINKLPAFIRQVVNDARQNKPSIKVHPADSGADPETAEVINGLIRNIEYTSNADVAYDTATDSAVSGGVGYIRVGLDYAYDDSFDMDLTIQRVLNPFSIYGDPNSVEADSSDWMNAFVVNRLSKEQFKKKYAGKAAVDWDDSTAWSDDIWRDGDEVLEAEWWAREEAEHKIYLTADGQVYTREQLENDPDVVILRQAGVIQITRERMAKTYKVTQRIMTGAEVVETNPWAGRYIPIIPVYGDEFDLKGKRYFRSLIHDAKDGQRMFNFWRTASTELVALAPRTPYLVQKGSVDDDIERWNTANVKSHPFLEYKGSIPPSRQPLDGGVAAGALQEALNASDDIKAIIGLYDASLGARSNETSGKAIMARQREGDISTFHFIDNMARAIRHTGRILIDLIPHVYTGERIIRVMGEDGKPENKQINKPYPMVDPQTGEQMRDEQGQVLMRIHDMSAGKYDLTVTTGPSFTTRREEAAYSMTEALRAFPQGAPVIVPELAKNLDWPGADDIAEKLEALTGGQVPPQVQQLIEQGKQKIGQLEQENQSLKQDQQTEMAKIAANQEQARGKIASDEQIKREQIASDERIAQERLISEQRLAVLKDGGVESIGPDGEKTVKSKTDMGFEAVMQGLNDLGQMVVQQGEMNTQALMQIAQVVAAPTELVRDEAGRAVGSRKVMN